MSRAVFGIANNRLQGEALVAELKWVGFSNQSISLIMLDSPAHQEKSGSAKNSQSRADLSEGAFGWLDQVGGVAIPREGSYIAGGPLMVILQAQATGVPVGGLVGALVLMGFSDSEARTYQEQVQQGKILIGIHAETFGDVKRAKEVFQEFEANEILATEDATINP
jgi:hypothetical protein